ncbi:hypothetical protein BJY01DRAFT_228752 [Aspergillus pseudoustus]|uniref:Uncharacterized protein n=1 Tax=Aspergillus pseudoustus TaxID=1810923 RepID=A0ABR4ILJ6_9EURO
MSSQISPPVVSLPKQAFQVLTFLAASQRASQLTCTSPHTMSGRPTHCTYVAIMVELSAPRHKTQPFESRFQIASSGVVSYIMTGIVHLAYCMTARSSGDLDSAHTQISLSVVDCHA